MTVQLVFRGLCSCHSACLYACWTHRWAIQERLGCGVGQAHKKRNETISGLSDPLKSVVESRMSACLSVWPEKKQRNSRGPKKSCILWRCTLMPLGKYDGSIFAAATMRPYATIILATWCVIMLQEMTLPVLSVLHDVKQRHVFFIHHDNQRHWVDAIFARVMTSSMTSHFDFRFATVDGIVAAHPCFSVEQVVTCCYARYGVLYNGNTIHRMTVTTVI